MSGQSVRQFYITRKGVAFHVVELGDAWSSALQNKPSDMLPNLNRCDHGFGKGSSDKSCFRDVDRIILTEMTPALETRWLSLCSQAGLDGRAEWLALSAAYSDPARAYHNWNHIADCLLRFDEYVHLAVDPVAVEFAIWFHDIIYDTHASDNEERSAMIATEFLSSTSHGAGVADLIRATRHNGLPGTPDEALLCDIDLSILGRPPVVYDAYARAIRQEYAWVPLPEFVKGRTRVLESFLGRPSVFVLKEMEEVYGKHARVNLMREIQDLADLALG